MKNWILRWVASVLALLFIVLGYWVWLTSASNGKPVHFGPETQGIWVETPLAILIAVFALGLANSVIRPIILFFAWPINCVTFGLFSFALNVLLFLLVGNIGLGFHVNGILHALIGSVAMGFLSGFINFLLKDKNEGRRRRREPSRRQRED